MRRFPRSVGSLERLMLDAMRARLRQRVQRSNVLAADAAARAALISRTFLRLAARVGLAVRDAVLALREPALLVRPGLLARYDLMDLLETVAQASARRAGRRAYGSSCRRPVRAARTSTERCCR